MDWWACLETSSSMIKSSIFPMSGVCKSWTFPILWPQLPLGFIYLMKDAWGSTGEVAVSGGFAYVASIKQWGMRG